MRCPFLREAHVKSCWASEFKKMIVRSQGDESSEICSSSAYVTCPSVKQRNEEIPSQTHCPFLQESLVQYCSDASVVKYVPYSDPSLSRCGTSNHRYCELFLMISHPNLLTSHEVDAPTLDSEDSGPWIIDGVQTTGWHFYSANHMWADIDEEGICHVGIDPFFAKVLGRVDKLAFATTFGEHHPGAVITVNDVDFPMVFPNRINITAINSHLRAEPNRLVSDPYTFGWLFEGTALRETSITKTSYHGSELVHGKKAREWMRNETCRLSESLRSKFTTVDDKGLRLMADGGIFGSDIIKHMSRTQALMLYSKFFSPNINFENR
jgi:glycine cleavage system H lipoate-binding protein